VYKLLRADENEEDMWVEKELQHDEQKCEQDEGQDGANANHGDGGE
jgi:hypothetical protein